MQILVKNLTKDNIWIRVYKDDLLTGVTLPTTQNYTLNTKFTPNKVVFQIQPPNIPEVWNPTHKYNV
jgi:hypothetical protein